MYGNKATWRIQVISDAQEPAPAAAPTRQIRVVAPVRATSNAHNGQQTACALPQQPIPQSNPIEDLLVRCFVCAGKALRRAHNELLAQGFAGLEAPIWEDIRAAGISLFIERNRRDREAA